MGSCQEMNNTSDQNVSYKPALKATPAVRIAFDELVSEEGFLKSSEIILKYFASLMLPGQEHEELPEDAKYVVKRLITSLASQRMHIRQGCYTIFQVLLQLYPQILTFSWLFIEKFYRVKSQESLADYNMGHVLALGAIIRSGLAMEEELSLEDVIKKLLKMMDLKFVMDPVIGQFLVNLLSMYKDKNMPIVIWKVCQQSLSVDMNTLSTPLLWLRVLIARDEYIKDLHNVPESFQKNTYDETTYENVLSVLKKLFTVGVNITPMVEDYFKSLILYRPVHSDGEDNLSLFFSTAVTPALSSNLKTNVLLFNITQVALSHLTSKKSIEAVLSPELMEMLVLSCRSDMNEVSASARGLFSAVLQLLVKNKERGSKIQVAVIKRLVSTSKKLNVDSFTKTTILQQASDNLSAESVNSFVKFLIKNSRNLPDNSSKSKKFEYAVSTCQWINRLMGHSCMTGVDQRTWKAEQVSHLFRIAYLSGFNQMQQHQMLKDSFLKGLTQSSNNIEWQASFIKEIVQNVYELVNNEELKELNRDQVNLFISTSDKLKNLSDEGNETLSSGDLAVFKILYGYMSLGVFIDSKDSEELVEEIDQCYKNAARVKKKKKKGKPLDKKYENSDEPEWREVVMDLLLSLISKEESFWRKVATLIFINICHKIKPSVLSLLTDVINPEKDEPILESKTNEETINQSSVDCEDLDDLDTSMEVDTEEMSESEEELDESDDDEDDDEDEAKAGDKDKIGMINLKKKMQEVVGLPLESVELDSVPEEELENLDKQLGSLINKYVALSNKRKKKIKFSKDETALMCFRTRVCDLLEILIKEAPSLDHILQVIKPILMAITKSLEDKLQNHLLKKLRSLIVEVSQVKKFGNPSSVSPEELATYLTDIFSMAKSFSNLMKADISHCCTFLVRSEQHFNCGNKKESNVVMKAYADYLEKAFSETSSEIYDGPIHLETVSLEMVLKVLSVVIFKKNTRPFNKKKGLEMLKEILNNEKALYKMTSKNLKVVLQTIQGEIVSTFDRVQQTKHVQSNYLTMLIEILKTLKKVFKSYPEMEDLPEWEKVINSVTSFCQRIPLKDFKTLKNAIQSLTNINNFLAKSYKEEKSNSTENKDAKLNENNKKSKKKRKLEQLEENDPEELNAEKEVKEETLNEERKKDENIKMKKEEENEHDWEDITGEKKKKKKKKKKHHQEERIKKNEARLWISDDINGFNFANVNNFEAEL